MSLNKNNKWLLFIILIAVFFLTVGCGAASTVSAQPALNRPTEFLLKAADLPMESEAGLENIETYLDKTGFHIKTDFNVQIDQKNIWIGNHITFQDHQYDPVSLLLEPQRFEDSAVFAFDQLDGIGDEAIFYHGEQITLENIPEARGRGTILRFYKENVFVELVIIGENDLGFVTDLAVKIAQKIPLKPISFPEIQGIGETIDWTTFDVYFYSIQLSNGTSDLGQTPQKNMCIEIEAKTPDQKVSTAIYTEEQELITRRNNYILPYKVQSENNSHIQRDCDLQRLEPGNYIYKVWAVEKLVAILPFTVQ
ncbi:MAG: hypothetical protein JEZ06_01650 [Anaerolineaceae bacterium]|nr:hypothetical protein [Anaerolineaceae bacterium]